MTKLFISAFLAASALVAQDAALQMDPAETNVEYTLGDVLHTVHGTFKLKRANIRFDPATGKATGEMVVDAASGSSGNSTRDRRMHKEILESAQYPEIVFRPTRLEGRVAPQGASQAAVHGIFSIHGVDHEIVMPVEVEATGSEYKLVAHFPVPYVKWGMKNPSNLFLRVNSQVDIVIHTVARPAHQYSKN